MVQLIILLAVFAVLHLVLEIATTAAIGLAVVITGALWLLWKLRWLILGIVGLDVLFGGGGDD